MRKIILILSLLCCFTWMFADEDAGQPGEFLRYGIDARALGMGRAYTAGTDGSSAIYWNAAALAHLNRMECGFMHQSLYFNTNYQYASFAYPYVMNQNVALAASFLSLGTTDIERRESVTGNLLGSFDNQESAVYIGGNYFKVFHHGLYSAGLTTKWVYQSVDGNNGSGIGADLSLQYHPIFLFGLTQLPLKYTLPLRFGLTFQNLLAPSITIEDEADKFPSSLRFGLAYAKFQNLFFGYIPTGKTNIQFSYDLEKVMADQERAMDHFLGLEIGYPIQDFYPAVRLGFNTTDENMNLGTGVIWNWEKAKIAVDYAFVSHPDLETSHRIGLKVAFGGHKDLRQHHDREPDQLARLPKERLWKYLTDYAYDQENSKKEYDNVAKALVTYYKATDVTEEAPVAVADTTIGDSAQVEVAVAHVSHNEKIVQRLFEFTGGLSFVDILFERAQTDFYQKYKLNFASVAKEYKKNEAKFKDDEAELTSLNNYAEAHMMESQYSGGNAWDEGLQILKYAEAGNILAPLKTKAGNNSAENHRREYLKGVCYFRQAEPDSAKMAFQFVQKSEIHQLLAQLNLAIIDLQANNADQAKGQLDQLLGSAQQLPVKHPPYPYFSDRTLTDDVLFLQAVAEANTNPESAIQKVNEILFLYPETDLALMLRDQKDELINDGSILRTVFENEYLQQFANGRIDGMQD